MTTCEAVEERAFVFTEAERLVFREPEPISPSVWAERSVVLKEGPYAGSYWDNAVTPYLVEPMDAWGLEHVEEVVIAGAPQTGKTRAMYNCLAYSGERRHGPKMLAMPDDENLKRVSQTKLRPSFEASPAIARILAPRAWTLAVAMFRDGSPLYFSSAQAPGQRASVSVRDLFLDEEDLYKSQAGKGNPVRDFLGRTSSYEGMRKHFRVCQPVGGEESSIWQAMLACSEIRRFHARCPICHEYQPLEFRRIVFQGCRDPQEMKQRQLARYECAHCRAHWTDEMRNRAVTSGRWRPARMTEGGWADCEPTERPRSVGFHVPAILSRFVRLSEIAADFLEAEEKGLPDLWRSFFNIRLAEPYVPVAVKTSVEKILEMRVQGLRSGLIPRAAVALTAGIDVQQRGFWFTVRAWSLTMESWLVDYGRLGTWDDVYKLLFESGWEQEETGEWKQIWRAAIDSGGSIEAGEQWSKTEEVYQWVRANGAGVAFATKGASGPQLRRVKPSPIDRMPRSGQPIPGGLELYLVDPFAFKEIVHANLRPEARQAMRLHEAVGADYAAQLSSEVMVVERGRKIWKQVKSDNHLFDCECLARACVDEQWSPSLRMIAGLSVAREAEAAETVKTGSVPRPTPAAARNRPSWFKQRG